MNFTLDDYVKRRPVRMANAGQLQSLDDFHHHYQREKDLKLVRQKRAAAATIIQAHWKAHTCKRQLADILSKGFVETSDLCKATRAICILSLLPVIHTWRLPHTSRDDRSTTLCRRQRVNVVSRESMMMLLLQSKTGAVVSGLNKPTYLTAANCVKDWRNLKGEKRVLPPMWCCSLVEYVTRLCPNGPGTSIEDKGIPGDWMESALLIVLSTLDVWEKFQITHSTTPLGQFCTNCITSSDVELTQHRAMWILSHRRIAHPTSVTFMRAANSTPLTQLIAAQLVQNKLWDSVTQFIDSTSSVKLCQGLMVALAQVCKTDADYRSVLIHDHAIANWSEQLLKDRVMGPQEKRLLGRFALRLGTSAARICFKTPLRLRDHEGEGVKVNALLSLLAFSLSGTDKSILGSVGDITEDGSHQTSLMSTDLLRYLFDANAQSSNLMCRLRVLFLRERLDGFFSASVQPTATGPDGVEKAILECLLNPEEDPEDETNRLEGELYGFIEPIDIATFDQLVVCTNVITKIYISIGQRLFRDCEGSIIKFADSLGTAPCFSSDHGLELKTLLAMILRKCLLLDDKQFVTMSSEESDIGAIQDAEKVWMAELTTDSTLFPLTLAQLNLLCHFLNCLSVELITRVSNWSTEKKLCLKFSAANSRVTNLSYLLLDLTRLTRFLHRRCRRLQLPLDQWVIPQINHLIRYMRVRPDVCRDLQLFRSMTPIARRAAVGAILISLNEVPHSVAFTSRVDVLQTILSADRRRHGRHDSFIPYTARRVAVRRSHIVEDSAIFLLKDQDLRAPMQIQFIGEDGEAEMGVDGGGLFREYLILLSQDLFNPERGLFKLAGGALTPSMSAWEIFQYDEFQADTLFKLAGIVVGKALYESLLLGSAELCPLFLNRILGEVNYFDDLKISDPEVHKNISFIKHYEGDAADLALTFSLTESSELRSRGEIPLVPNGTFTKVTNENKHQYILLLSHYLANTTFDKATKHFLDGLERVVDMRWLRLFDAHGLQQLISGVKQIGFDVDDLRPFTKYSGYEATDQIIIDFWDIVASETPEFRSKLLHFVTSTTKTPLLGFQSMNPPFCIIKGMRVDELPSASTCVNLIKLPAYGDKQTLHQKLKAAVEGAEGFHLA